MTFSSNGMILEDMSFYSMELVRPAYFEKTLSGKIARDEDSIEMLEIITQSVAYDPAFLLLHNGILHWRNGLRRAITQGTPAASFVASQIESNNKTLQDAYTAIRNNQNH